MAPPVSRTNPAGFPRGRRSAHQVTKGLRIEIQILKFLVRSSRTEEEGQRTHQKRIPTAEAEAQRPASETGAMRLPHASDLRAFLAAAAVAHLSSSPASRASPCAAPPLPAPRLRTFASSRASTPPSSPAGAVASAAAAACEQAAAKPAICTADELHYAPVPGTEWRLALWRYRPPPEVRAASGGSVD